MDKSTRTNATILVIFIALLVVVNGYMMYIATSANAAVTNSSYSTKHNCKQVGNVHQFATTADHNVALDLSGKNLFHSYRCNREGMQTAFFTANSISEVKALRAHAKTNHTRVTDNNIVFCRTHLDKAFMVSLAWHYFAKTKPLNYSLRYQWLDYSERFAINGTRSGLNCRIF